MRRSWHTTTGAATLAVALASGLASVATAPPAMAAVRAAVLRTSGPTASSAVQAPPVVTAMSVTPNALTLTGLETRSVTVSVSLTGNSYGDPTAVYLSRTTPAWDRSAPWLLTAGVHRVAGTTTAGTYEAGIRVPSSAHGLWRVAVLDFGGITVDVRDSGLPDATLDVTGSHRPRMRFLMSPQPLPYPRHDLTITVRALFEDTRAPITGQWVYFGSDSFCAESYAPQFAVRTDGRGNAVWRTTIPGDELLCAWTPFPAAPRSDRFASYNQAGGSPLLGTVITAKPRRTTVPRRTTTGVDGQALSLNSIAGIPAVVGARVALQRLVGRHWRTVSEGRVRKSTRFTLYASPPKGRNLYRAALPAQNLLGSSTSKVFVVTGT